MDGGFYVEAADLHIRKKTLCIRFDCNYISLFVFCT